MNYALDDDIIKLIFLADEDKILEIQIFCTFYEIHTISDFLKHGESARNETMFEKIIESLRKKNFKFDDELTEEELKKRNEERKRIEMENTISQKELEELLSKGLEILNINSKLRRKLERNGIENINKLISGERYLHIIKMIKKNKNSFTLKEINEIIKALNEIGLRLNMLNPLVDSININIQAILEEKEQEETREEVLKISEKPSEELLDLSQSKAEEATAATKKTRKVNTKTLENWKRKIEYLKVFKHYFGHLYVQEKLKDEGIGNWIKNRRNDYKRGKLSHEKIEELESIGMSWKGVGISSDAKEKIYRPLNIKDVTVENGILYTYYIDGTKKSTDDKEFKELLKQFREGKTDLSKVEEKLANDQIEEIMTEEAVEELLDSIVNEQEEQTETTDINPYLLMQARIEEMRAKKQAITEENESKRLLIEEYRDKLLHELDSLIQESMQLDIEINSIIGINNSIEAEEISQTSGESQETAEQIKQQIEEITEENERKKVLIQEYRKVEEELKRVQNESEELDSQITFISNQTDESKVKKLGEL
ncbi:MAG: Helicase associated domain protein [Bacilli bacterium]|nr:Helicase associated domain protein [Bacilli bacterium]